MSLNASIPTLSFRDLLQQLSCWHSNETIADGERKWILTEIPNPPLLAPLQMTARDLKYLPRGTFSFQDYKFYQEDSPLLVQHDVIEYAGNRYSVEQIEDRTKEGGYTRYNCKEIVA